MVILILLYITIISVCILDFEIFYNLYYIHFSFCAHFNYQGLVSVPGRLWGSLIQNNDTNNKGIMI